MMALLRSQYDGIVGDPGPGSAPRRRLLFRTPLPDGDEITRVLLKKNAKYQQVSRAMQYNHYYRFFQI